MNTRILVPSTYKDATAPVVEVASLSPRRASLLRTLADLLSHVRAGIATARATCALRFAQWCRDTFGPVELQIGGYPCGTCSDIHPDGYKCPHQLRGICLDCERWRTLDRFGMCPSGHSSVVRRELRWPDARKQREFLQGTPMTE
jgi:hypothetical protein